MSCINELYRDEPAKWKTRELRQIHTVYTAEPVGMGRKSRQYTILQNSVQAHDFLPNKNWISSCMHLPQYPRLPFFRLTYIQLINLCRSSPIVWEKRYVISFHEMTKYVKRICKFCEFVHICQEVLRICTSLHVCNFVWGRSYQILQSTYLLSIYNFWLF